jgi:hypothetical protein
MNGVEFLALLDKKALVIRAVCSKTEELQRHIRSNNFSEITAIDSAREGLIRELVEADRMLENFKKPDRDISEKAKSKMKNINSSLDYLIKLEKENETLLEQARISFSGEYITAYKTYKRPE